MPIATKDESAQPAATESYIPPGAQLRECTPRAIVLGTLLGVVFGAASLYLVLKVGLTVSASIPVAVISVAIFRLCSKVFGLRDASILENNIVQTAGSAGESIAFGVGVTMPAILILGADLEVGRVTLVGLLGGLLGILMMIPLRRALIVQQHGKLKYPEGTACAEVLKAGADEESRAASAQAGKEKRALHAELSAAPIFTGFGIGLLYKTAMSAFRLWKEVPEKVFGAPFKGGSVACEIEPALLGVGYIIGPAIASTMAAGGALAYLVLIPLIKFFGEGMTAALPPGTVPIKDMAPNDIRGKYILYIGAGAVAAGGIISLLRSSRLIWHGIRAGLADFGAAAMAARTGALRTDRDLSMKFVVGGCLVLIAAILAVPSLQMNLLGALLIVIFGFLFVTVSSRLTGEIGSSSNPISGMTVATLLLTCLIFVIVGWTGSANYVTALSVGGIVCIAASNGGSTSQDLKTGFLVGATPKFQQIAILIGAAASAFALGPLLLKLNSAETVYVPAAKVAPGLRAPADARLSTPVKLPEELVAVAGAHPLRVWLKTDVVGGPEGKYFVDETGAAVWFEDPGINGTFKQRQDGTTATKFSAPKAQLMSYIIKGILGSNLPWALVLFGVMIAIVLEMCGIPSLAFAVGVYLPLSSSTPLFVGGLVRWLVDRRVRRDLQHHDLDEAELAAHTDRSPGVLLSSGYIAGGAIAGIIIAILLGLPKLRNVNASLSQWAEGRNPFYAGANADWLALIPFLALVAYLYIKGRPVQGAKRTT